MNLKILQDHVCSWYYFFILFVCKVTHFFWNKLIFLRKTWVIRKNHKYFLFRIHQITQARKIAWRAILWGLHVVPDHREEPRCILDEGEDALGQETISSLSSLEGCTWLAFYVWHFAMYCPPGSIRIMGLIPAHPRFTRMYGVTSSTVFQTVQKLRNLNSSKHIWKVNPNKFTDSIYS